jgi:hypothetical protein
MRVDVVLLVGCDQLAVHEDGRLAVAGSAGDVTTYLQTEWGINLRIVQVTPTPASTKECLSKLVNALTAYEGFGDPGQLTENVKIYTKLREDLDNAINEAIKELE